MKKTTFEDSIEFCVDFGANLAPFRCAKSIKIRKKIDSKSVLKNDRFKGVYLIDLGCHFGRQDGPRRGP